MPAASPGCYLCFWPHGCKLEVPMTPPGVWLICRGAHRTQRNSLLTKFQVYYKRICGRDAWSKVQGEGVDFHALSECAALPASPRVHQPRSFLYPVLMMGSYGGFVTQAWLAKSLAIGDWIQSSPERENKGFSSWEAGFMASVPCHSCCQWFEPRPPA